MKRIFLLVTALLICNQTLAGHNICASLEGVLAPKTKIESSTLLINHLDLPEACQVKGVVDNRIEFVMRMPTDNWNSKLVVAGCGGFCGSLVPDKPGYSNSINEAVKLGYAAITTDSGHQAESWDTDWAIGDDRALDLYAGAWMPLVVDTGSFLVQHFYGNQSERTYFSGCSNGGRLGMFAAQRYPELFDGIAAGGGVFDFTGNAGIHGIWLLQATIDPNGDPLIPVEKIPLLGQHVMSQCDSLDGTNDGIVSRPDLCTPEIDSLICDAEENSACFSAEAVSSIKKLYRGATVSGKQLYPGINPGSESLWPIWVIGSKDELAWGQRAAEGNLRLTYDIPSSETFEPHDYVLAEELENLQKLAPTVDAVNPDLSALKAAGNKLFYYHGLADPLILAGRAQQYYREAVAEMGADSLNQVARFVMMPGHGHCWEKPNQVPDDFNPLVVIDRWVDQGIAPDELLAVQKNPAGEVVRSRKLCAMPTKAEYKGGDKDQATSYTCM